MRETTPAPMRQRIEWFAITFNNSTAVAAPTIYILASQYQLHPPAADLPLCYKYIHFHSILPHPVRPRHKQQYTR